MGDIYHAGEVYAGSVPIDDTQASEDTVYSSAKVETMMEEVQSKTCSLTPRINGISGDPAIRRRGHVCEIQYVFKLPAGTYAGQTQVIHTASPKPIMEQHFIAIIKGNLTQMKINTNGNIVFNETTTISESGYVIAELVYLTDGAT